MTYRLTADADDDLREIYAYISRDSPLAADRVIDRLGEVFGRIASGELQGPIVRLRGGVRAQAWPVPPHRVYYSRDGGETIILRVYHQARRSIEA
jgi:plasmid stabilization system protein ParE